MNPSPLGSYGFILSQRAQQYDIKEKEWWARQWAGHTIKAGRTCETAMIASGLPSVEEFKKDRVPFWYLGLKSAAHYSNLINDYIDTAQAWKILQIDSGIMKPLWQLKGDVLDASGKYLKKSYSERVFSHKMFQIDSIVLMNYIATTSPSVKELDLNDLGVSASQLTQDLSRLEALGVIKRTGHGKPEDQRLILLPLAVETYGKEIEEQLSEALAEPLSRYILGFIRKMPGIRFSTLLGRLGIPLEDAVRIKIANAIKLLRQHHIIITIYDQSIDDLLLVPAWVCHSLVRNYHPTVLDSKMLKEAVRVCSIFWDMVTGVSQVDSQINTLKSHLRWLLSKSEVSFKEIAELGIYANFIYKLRFVGLIEPVGRESFRVIHKNIPIIEVLFHILSEAYAIEVESEKVSAARIDAFLQEIDATMELVVELLSERLSLKDIENYSGFK